ncbi:MAG: GNAT family N-acetyltransferase [Pyrinomonadaceae bacterium]
MNTLAENKDVVIEIAPEIELRTATLAFAKELHQLVKSNLKYLAKWMSWATENIAVRDLEEFLRREMEVRERRTGINFCVFNNQTMIGNIGAKEIDSTNRSAEIGYWIAEDAQGNGIATNACKAIINLLFTEYELNRIVIKCGTENYKSQAIPERLGFTNEGISRQVLWLNDRFIGLSVYSLLKEEWNQGSEN